MTINPELQQRVTDSQGRWWHSIDLGEYGQTQGYKTPEILEREWQAMRVPALAGKSVLDIGAWDGYFSFRAEREGAASVTSLDHYVWSFDPLEKIAYEAECRAKGETPKPWDEIEQLWRPHELPGKRSYDVAHDALGSRAEVVVGDFMALPREELPTADVVFFLGVLYHLKDMVEAFSRLRHVTKELAIIETEAADLPEYAGTPVAEFTPEDQMSDDPTNWWAPNDAALVGLARSAGFSKIEVVQGAP
ncbi:MAG TPA: hypothetical protein VGM93_12960, partial [Acidimicrobiales bacterium]